MPTVEIKDVPEGAEDAVKQMAMVAIERFLREKNVIVPKETVTKFEGDVDTIRATNGLSKKFEVLTEEKT